MQDRAMVTVEH